MGAAGYTGAIPISGGTGADTLVSQSNLPPGLTAVLSGSNVVFTGTPSTAGTYGSASVTVQDATGATATGTFSITIYPAPTLGGLSSSAWTVNQPGYSGAIIVSGGAGPFGNLSATGLPAGVTASLSGNTITLGGTPTAAGTYGNVDVSVTDADGVTASGAFSITINASPALGALTPSQWTVGAAGYTGAIPISGGTGADTLVSQSNLPPGLTAVLSGGSVVFTGTPSTAGTYGSASVTVQDATGATAAGTFSITINPAPTLGALPVTAWTVNQPGYSSSITVSGGTGTFGGLTATGLPAGLTASLSGNTITLSGTPTATGYYSQVTIGVLDSAALTAAARTS